MALDNAAVGKTLLDLRNRCGLTQRELAERANLTVNFISLVENGSRGLSPQSLDDYAKALGVAPQFVSLLAGDETEIKDPALAKLSKSLKKAILATIDASACN